MTEPVGQEPDPRFTLANERTFLAWVRTMLTLMAGAVALESLEIPTRSTLRTVVVVSILVFAATTMVLAYRRWRHVERAIRLGRPLPSFVLGLVVTAAIVVFALLLVLAVL